LQVALLYTVLYIRYMHKSSNNNLIIVQKGFPIIGFDEPVQSGDLFAL